MLLVLTAIAMLLEPRRYALESVEHLRLLNVTAEPAMLQGKKGLKITMSRMQQYAQGLVCIEGLDFSNGAIEAEIAGALAPEAGAEARGFVGIAFRVQEDLKAYDAFYLRPTNGRADDQERRNHSVQYISLPEWPWDRLRKETPGRYEAYVDLVPGTWTKIKVEVRGEQARLYVHGNEQPTLMVKDVKSGANGHGGVALWLEPGTVAHFRNVTVEPAFDTIKGPMSLTEFRNEALVDFSTPENRAAMQAALAKVKGQLGQDHPLRIGGQNITTSDKLKSLNPSRPAEVVGVFSKADQALAEKAMQAALAAFATWSKTPAAERIAILKNAASIIRSRKYEFSAWMVYEVGKTWPEADADTAETIDFIEYYARHAEAIFTGADKRVTPIAGERNEMRYIPLGVGLVIPPWNFPFAITTGMTVASLVCGNTVVLKPSSDSPAIAYKMCEVLEEAGLPGGVLNYCPGSGSAIGDYLVMHPKTRFVAFTGSKEVGLRINELAAKPQKGQIWIKRVVAEMGGKDAMIVDNVADVDKAVEAVTVAAFGYQGQKCSACSRAIVVESVYDKFLDKLKARVEKIKVGPSDDPANYMGPVINAGSFKSISEYIEVGKKEGRVVTGGGRAGGPESAGYFLQPTVIADVPATGRLSQEEIFGPVLAVTKAKDFDQALEFANNTEFGLTGGVFTDSKEKLEKARETFHVGNLYLNRKCTGAFVGGHPFGGFNMSGTDSKAGGPDYLLLFTQAKTVSEKLG